MSLRTKLSFSIENQQEFKKQLFSWAKQFETITWLDSNNYQQNYTSFKGVYKRLYFWLYFLRC